MAHRLSYHSTLGSRAIKKKRGGRGEIKDARLENSRLESNKEEEKEKRNPGTAFPHHAGVVVLAALQRRRRNA